MPNFSRRATGSVAGAASLKNGSAADEMLMICSGVKSKCSKPSERENSEMLNNSAAFLRYSSLRM